MLTAAQSMRYSFLALAVCAACAEKAPPSTPADPAAAPQAAQPSPAKGSGKPGSSSADTPPATLLGSLPAKTTSIARLQSGNIFILDFFGDQLGGRKAECWRGLESGIVAGYQVETMGSPKSYFVFQGTFDRPSVESCATAAFPTGAPMRATISRDGERTIVDSDFGKAVLWWRADGSIVAGTGDQLAEVQAAKEPLSANPCMQKMLPELSKDSPLSFVRCDAFFENVLGVPTLGWAGAGTIAKAAAATNDKAPVIQATISVLYASEAEAARAATVMKSKKFPKTLPQEIAEFVASFPSTAEGDRLRIDFKLSKEDFSKANLAALQRLTGKMQAEGSVPAR